MILFTILLVVLAMIAAVVLSITGLVGGSLLLVFGDVIVCALIIVLLVKLFGKKK